MRSPRRGRRVFGLAVALVGAIGCVAGSCSAVRDSARGSITPGRTGTFVVATSLPAPGFWKGDVEHLDGGMEWGIANAMASRFHLRPKVIDIPFQDIAAGRLHGADVALSQISITSARRKLLYFSVPYFDSSPTLLARDGTVIADLKTARDQRWVVRRGTTEEQYLRDVVRPDHAIQVVDTFVEEVDRVTDGTADVALLDLPTALALANEHPGLTVPSRFARIESYGAASPRHVEGRSDSTLRTNAQAIDAAMRALISNGTVGDLQAKWLDPVLGQDPDRVPVIQIQEG